MTPLIATYMDTCGHLYGHQLGARQAKTRDLTLSTLNPMREAQIGSFVSWVAR